MKFVEIAALSLLICAVGNSCKSPEVEKPVFSGIYPHLAYYNEEGECGTGAVVPWADRLWVITYAPHKPGPSSDKLYEITPELEQIVREESVGGTPANRLIHAESNQLFIGPYAIDGDRNVQVISYDAAPGRYTGAARHLTDPANKIYVGTMEEGFYDVDVHSLQTTMLFEDGNSLQKRDATDAYSKLLPGDHGKGLYSGQGVLVYSNNGEKTDAAKEQFDVESGVLAEWNEKDWTVIRRNQFTEITGPGGIRGNSNPKTDPIWATGWDNKSVLLGIRSPEQGWTFYRLPKASHTYDGAHGWNTEWPRIRDVGTASNPDYLMTMHGLFWKVPATLSVGRTAGIRPRSAYLKVIGDYTRWQDRLVFGCDDSAQKEFLNTRGIKGGIEGPGQSNSNLWFTSLDQPDNLGPNTAEGAVWLSEEIMANEISEPFLFAGWKNRAVWIKNEGKQAVSFLLEVDVKGNGQWTSLKTIDVQPGETVNCMFEEQDKGEWIRVKSKAQTRATVHFTYTDHSRYPQEHTNLFRGMATAIDDETYTGGLLYGLGDNRRALGMLAGKIEGNRFIEKGYYELDGNMKLVKKDDPETANFIRKKYAIPKNVVTIDQASALVVDDKGRRWRLPLGSEALSDYTRNNLLRICREVATERDLLSLLGTFYELPAENADGFAKIRPISSHQLTVHDYASYRGLLVMSGIGKEVDNKHIIRSEDGQARVWVGAIDDLWKLGKPVGRGGPWKNTDVQKHIPSDPYLIGFYDKKKLELSHESDASITFKIQVEPVGHGPWMTYKEVEVKPGETYSHIFPESFQSRWIRFESDQDCQATAWLTYN
ncbi:hypothetical protein [Sphingobacterium phlebotomi]|uniref:hypothetical protein n=1 Tax=Sphingobacterium phlebotomi TaxID=2605433 RepID=UPI001CA34F48|nr:hypothetical protein [Sphingobacterium phlebotomi]